MLDLPDVVDAEAVGQLDLGQRVLEQAMLGVAVPRPRQLVLVEESEAHCSAFREFRPSFSPCRQCAVQPPSTTRPAPVMKLASSDARKTMPLAMSSAMPSRPIGCRASDALRACSVSLVPTCWARMTKVFWPMSVSIRPGWIELTRMP